MEPGSSDWWEHRLKETPGLSSKQVKEHEYFEIALDCDKVTPRWKGGPGVALRDIFLAAGLFEDVALEEKLGLADSLILATARQVEGSSPATST